MDNNITKSNTSQQKSAFSLVGNAPLNKGMLEAPLRAAPTGQLGLSLSHISPQGVETLQNKGYDDYEQEYRLMRKEKTAKEIKAGKWKKFRSIEHQRLQEQQWNQWRNSHKIETAQGGEYIRFRKASIAPTSDLLCG